MAHLRPTAIRFASLTLALAALLVPLAISHATDLVPLGTSRAMEQPAEREFLLALSELQSFEAAEDSSPSPGGIDPELRSPASDEPESERPAKPAAAEEPNPAEAEADEAETDAGEEATSLPAILYDPALLPGPAIRMRELILEAAATGDIEALRPLVGLGPNQTRLATTRIEEDPIDYLRGTSGDGEGVELLAILLDVLDAGFVKVERPADQGGAYYLWPYFAALPIEELTASQEVELLRIVTAGDYDEMQIYGGYNFYRVAITEEGVWEFFLAGH